MSTTQIIAAVAAAGGLLYLMFIFAACKAASQYDEAEEWGKDEDV